MNNSLFFYATVLLLFFGPQTNLMAQIAGKDTIAESEVPLSHKTKLLEGLTKIQPIYWFKAISGTYGVEYSDSTGASFVRLISIRTGDTRAKTYKILSVDEVPEEIVAKAQMGIILIEPKKVNRVYFRSSRYLFEIKGQYTGTQLIEIL